MAHKDVVLPLDQVKTVSKKWGKEKWLLNLETGELPIIMGEASDWPVQLAPGVCVKVLHIEPNKFCSWHEHHEKAELFCCLGGSGIIHYFTTRPEQIEISPYDKALMPPNNIHKIQAGDKGLVLLEISTFHKESDSYRYTEDEILRQ